MRLPHAILALLAALLAATRPARADEPNALARVDFGWGSTITAGRWTPVRVWLDGSAGALAGVLTIEFEQDRTQLARVLVPGSTTPGALTPVDLAVCIPSDVGQITVTYSSPGRRDERLSFAPPPTAGATATPRPGQLQLGQLYGGTRGLLAQLGVPSLERSFPKPIEIDVSPAVQGRIIEGFLGAAGDNLTQLRWMQLACASLQPDDLPAIPQAYEGLEALVLDAGRAANLPPRTRQAILTWVRAGGRLVVLSTDDSNAWRSWLPEGEDGELLARPAPARTALPASILEGVSTSTYKFFTETADARHPSWGPPAPLHVDTSPAPDIPLRKEAAARPVLLTPAGKAAGWRLGWPLGHDAGLYAQGPVGLGLVTILGVDPEALPEGLDQEASRRLWRRALEPSVKEYLADPFSHDEPGAAEITSALNTILGVPPLRNTVFNTVLFSLAALALLLGPVDWFVLKRFRARQHSWLVALGWISLASVAAYIVPPMLRSGPPQVNRLLVTDLVQQSNALTSRAAACNAGLTGVFASGPLDLQFDPDPNGPMAGSWWHGVAASQQDFRRIIRSANERRDIRTISPIETPQLTSLRGDRQNIPSAIRMPSWSYRTMADSSSGAPPNLRARVTRGPGRSYKVEIAGLPEGAPVGDLSLYDSSGPVPAAQVDFTLPGGAPIHTDAACLPQRTQNEMSFDAYGNWRKVALRESTFHWSTQIPGALRRETALQARLDAGWTAVQIVLGKPGPWARFVPQAALDREGFLVSGMSTIRILIPPDPADADHADPPKEPAK